MRARAWLPLTPQSEAPTISAATPRPPHALTPCLLPSTTTAASPHRCQSRPRMDIAIAEVGRARRYHGQATLSLLHPSRVTLCLHRYMPPLLCTFPDHRDRRSVVIGVAAAVATSACDQAMSGQRRVSCILLLVCAGTQILLATGGHRPPRSANPQPPPLELRLCAPCTRMEGLPWAIFGLAEPFSGCAWTPWCSAATPSPPASLLRPAPAILLHLLCFDPVRGLAQ